MLAFFLYSIFYSLSLQFALFCCNAVVVLQSRRLFLDWNCFAALWSLKRISHHRWLAFCPWPPVYRSQFFLILASHLSRLLAISSSLSWWCSNLVPVSSPPSIPYRFFVLFTSSLFCRCFSVAFSLGTFLHFNFFVAISSSSFLCRHFFATIFFTVASSPPFLRHLFCHHSFSTVLSLQLLSWHILVTVPPFSFLCTHFPITVSFSSCFRRIIIIIIFYHHFSISVSSSPYLRPRFYFTIYQ